MIKLSQTSITRLNTCHNDLIRLIIEVAKNANIDFTVLEGARSLKQQEENVKKGVSATMNSKHLKTPSEAVDLAPCPIDWEDTERFKKLSEIVKETAKKLGIKIVWGGDWKTLVDMPHYEMKG
jgi:peptidoglycan L-alanyl-D-glutamate endopeptidase CwlK